MTDRSGVASRSRWAGARAAGAPLVARALVVAGAVLALACTRMAAHHLVRLVAILVVAASVVCARRPDSHLGLLVVLVVGVNWVTTVDDVTTPWSLGAAVTLTMFHAAMAAASIAPPSASWTRAMRRRWTRRPTALVLASAVVWLAVALIHARHLAGSAALLTASLAVLAGGTLWARQRTLAPTRGDERR